MSISSSTNKVIYNCNGSQTTFPITFDVILDSDGNAKYIKVIYTDLSGAENVLTEGVDYSISGLNVVTTTAYPAGTKITIARNMDYLQEVDLRDNEPFPAQTLEKMTDKVTMSVQQLAEELGRTVKIPISDDAASLDLPTKSVRANTYLYFDSDGNIETNPTAPPKLWISAHTYSAGEITQWNGVLYKSLQNNNQGNQPDTSPLWWEIYNSFGTEWQEGITYNQYEVVTRQGNFYKSLVNNNKGNDPLIDTTNWAIVNISGGTVWQSNETYNINDIVQYGGTFYVSLINTNIGNQPDTSPTAWRKLEASKIYVEDSAGLLKNDNVEDVLNELAPIRAKYNITDATDVTVNLPDANGQTAERTYWRTGSGTGKVLFNTYDPGTGAQTINGEPASNWYLEGDGEVIKLASVNGNWQVVQHDARTVVVSATDSGGQTFSSGVFTVVKWANEITDSHSAYDPTTGTFTVPISGTYEIRAGLALDTSYGMELDLYINGVREKLIASTFGSSNMQGSLIYDLTKGQSVLFELYQASGGTVTSIASAYLGILEIRLIAVRKKQ